MGWKNVDTIIEGRLYLGNLMAARSSRSLTERNITHILSIYVDYADILIHLPAACQFIGQAINSGGVVLVHCVQGISRSATVIALIVSMMTRRLDATQALQVEQLVLFGLCQYAPSPSNGFYASWKAKLERRLIAEGLQ
ncbi:protein-tyrosine phosphatase-like protein [Infundibulicybe gibba]|nr:protein-tyrosine phosphatase-like protein [Infundibulicybe gibba]